VGKKLSEQEIEKIIYEDKITRGKKYLPMLPFIIPMHLFLLLF